MIYAPTDPPTPALPFESFRFEDLAAGNRIQGVAAGACPPGGPHRVRIELGRARMHVRQVTEMAAGSVVVLDAPADCGVDIYICGRLVARGDVLVQDGSYCIRVTNVFGHSNANVTRTTQLDRGVPCTVS